MNDHGNKTVATHQRRFPPKAVMSAISARQPRTEAPDSYIHVLQYSQVLSVQLGLSIHILHELSMTVNA